MRAAIGEIADDNQRAGQNDGGVPTHKSDLHVSNRAAKSHHGAADGMNDAVDDPDIEDLPQSLARTHLDGLNDRRIVNLVDVVLVFALSGIGIETSASTRSSLSSCGLVVSCELAAPGPSLTGTTAGLPSVACGSGESHWSFTEPPASGLLAAGTELMTGARVCSK